MNLGLALDNPEQFIPAYTEQELFDLEHPPLILNLFGRTLQFRPFALCVAIAVLCGLLLLWLTARRAGLKSETVGTLGLLLLPLGLVFAHVFYVVTAWAWYESIGFGHALRLWEGGYAIWGAVLGCAAAVLLTSTITKERFSVLADVCAAPLALVIALCCFASYPFTGERLGRLIEFDTPFARFPFAVRDEAGDWYWAVFILEGCVALIIMLVLLFSRRTGGDKARLFLILYSAAQILCESLHKDDGKMLWYEFIRVPELMSAVVLAGLTAAGILRRTKASSPARLSGRRIAELLILLLHGLALAIGMEFAKDKLPELPNWVCYMMMADGCFMFGYAAYCSALSPCPARRKESA